MGSGTKGLDIRRISERFRLGTRALGRELWLCGPPGRGPPGRGGELAGVPVSTSGLGGGDALGTARRRGTWEAADGFGAVSLGVDGCKAEQQRLRVAGEADH